MVAVSPQAVESKLKQSRTLRVRVQVPPPRQLASIYMHPPVGIYLHAPPLRQELEAQRAAAKKKHDATVLLWEGRTSGLQAEVDSLTRQAHAIHCTRDELQSQLAVATQQAQRVQDAEEFAALQARYLAHDTQVGGFDTSLSRLQDRVSVCDAAVRRLQEQLSLMNQVDEDVQRQYAMARALEGMLQAKLMLL